jgi:hypothetical protein
MELLEQVDMENVVQTRARRQGQADGDLIDDFSDLVGP